MPITVAEISMSLDGFVTGPDPGVLDGLGRAGEQLHTWAFDRGDEVVAQVMADGPLATRAVVMGRRTFDAIDGPRGWQPDSGYVPGVTFSPPVFVVTHRPPEHARLARQCSFVTDGLAAAIELARAAAGNGNVAVMGGADIVRQAVAQRLVQQLRLHLAPVLLGAGTPLFAGEQASLVQESVRVSAHATHLRYRVS
jgi:dihydrofolate reductase